MSLFAAQQIGNLFGSRGCGCSTNRINAASYSVTQVTQQELNDLLFGAFQIGDSVQRGVVDFLFDNATGRAFSKDYLSRLTANVIAQTRDSVTAFSSLDQARLAWQELKNNYEVFNLVKHVSS